MKKLMVFLALCGMFGLIAKQANAVELPTNTSSIYQDDEKIDPDDLPKQVKKSIKKDDKMKHKKISDARRERKDNQIFYVVKFEKDDDGKEVTKKFDAMGNETKEDSKPPRKRPATKPTQGAPETNRPNL